jgi:toxin ParE1/3/4
MEYRISREAERDLEEIAEYSLGEFGERTAKRYLAALLDSIELLSTQPRMGRVAEYAGMKMRRVVCGKHMIYYRRDAKGILVVRIRHGRAVSQR